VNEDEKQSKVLNISEGVGVSFDALDVVVDPLKSACGKSVFHAGQGMQFVEVEDPGESFEVAKATGLRSSDPGDVEFVSFSLWKGPEAALLFLGRVAREEPLKGETPK
jgi:hypothetical protein